MSDERIHRSWPLPQQTLQQCVHYSSDPKVVLQITHASCSVMFEPKDVAKPHCPVSQLRRVYSAYS